MKSHASYQFSDSVDNIQFCHMNSHAVLHEPNAKKSWDDSVSLYHCFTTES